MIRFAAITLIVGIGSAWGWKYAYIAWKTHISMRVVFKLIYELSGLSGPIAVILDDLVFALVLAVPLAIPTWRLDWNSRYGLLALYTLGFLAGTGILTRSSISFLGGWPALCFFLACFAVLVLLPVNKAR